jgi:hypothetical protein
MNPKPIVIDCHGFMNSLYTFPHAIGMAIARRNMTVRSIALNYEWWLSIAVTNEK